MDKYSIPLEEQPSECDRQLQKTQQELEAVNSNVLEAQAAALSKSEQVRLCREQLEDEGKQLDLISQRLHVLKQTVLRLLSAPGGGWVSCKMILT